MSNLFWGYVFAPRWTSRVRRNQSLVESLIEKLRPIVQEGRLQGGVANRALAEHERAQKLLCNLLDSRRVRRLLRLEAKQAFVGAPSPERYLTILELNVPSLDSEKSPDALAVTSLVCAKDDLLFTPIAYQRITQPDYRASGTAVALSVTGGLLVKGSAIATGWALPMLPVFLIMGGSYRKSARKTVRELQQEVDQLEESITAWSEFIIKAKTAELRANELALALTVAGDIFERQSSLAYKAIVPLGVWSVLWRHVKGRLAESYVTGEEAIRISHLRTLRNIAATLLKCDAHG